MDRDQEDTQDNGGCEDLKLLGIRDGERAALNNTEMLDRI